MKLFRSIIYPARWFAFDPEIGWVMFPAEVGGWQKRQPARGIDPIDMREVPLSMGLNTGIPGAVVSGSGASDVPLTMGRGTGCKAASTGSAQRKPSGTKKSRWHSAF